MATINLMPEPAKGTISLAPTIVSSQDPAVLEDRAEKASYGMGQTSPGYESVLANMYLGAEGQIREEASLNDAIEDRQKKTQMVMDVSRAAATEGRGLTAEESEYVRSLSTVNQVAPSVVLEDLYARRFMAELDEYPDWGSFEEAFAEAPRSAVTVRDAGQDFLTKQEVAQKVLQETQERLENQSWFDTGVDFAKGVIPFYSWVQTKDRIEGTGSSSVFLGQNITEQLRGLYLLPPAEFESRLREAITGLSEENTMEAINLATAAVNYSGQDAAWNNLFTGLDAVDVATLGATAVVGNMTAATRYARRVKSAVQGSAAPLGGKPARQVLQGNIKGASQTKAINRLNGVLPTATMPTSANVAKGNTRPQQQLDDLLRAVPSMLDPKAYVRDAGTLSTERANRLVDNLSHQNQLLVSTLTDVSHLARIGPEAAQAGFQLAEKEFRRTYPKLEDTIVDVRPFRESEEIFGGVDKIEVLIGKKDATAFGRETQAEFFANKMYRLPQGSYTVVEREGNYFISMTKTIDETALQVRDLRIQTDNATPETFLNTWIGVLRTPDDLLSKRHSSLRKVSTYGGNAVMARLSESAKALGSLGKNERNRLRTIMDEARFKKRQITDTNGQQKWIDGVFYKDVGSLEKAYQAKGYSLPSDKEIQAYFEFKNISDWDYYQRNAGMLRDKARLGIEQKSIGVAQPDEAGQMRYKSTDFFEGRTIDQLPPASSQPYTVAWIDNKTGKADFGISNRLFPAQRQKLQELLETGNYKIIQPADPRDDVLGNILGSKGKSISGGEPVQYILVRDVKTKPLSSNQIPYNEGGHWNYPQTGVYLKQPKTHRTRFGRRVYDGDITAQYFPAGAQGEQFREAYEVARQMLLRNDPNLDAYVTRNLPYTGDEFSRLFKGAKGAPEDAPFDLNAPFKLTQSGQSVKEVSRLSEMFSDEIFDLGDNEHTLTGLVNSQYAQQRSERLLTIDNTGTEANPVYKLDHAPLIDPLESLARNAAQMARSRFFEDYKHSAIEDWITQFADTLDIPVGALRSDPLRYLKEPVFKTDYLNGAKLAAAKNARRSILQILGTEGQDVAAWKWTRQKIVDGIYKARGQKGVQIVDPLLWDSRTDPATIVRSAPFHAYLGLFNPTQLFLQGSATSMAMAIDGNPIRAAQSVFAYWGMRMRGLAESNIKGQGAITKAISGALGVDASTLDEMYDAWRRSGMHIIEGEYSKIDDYLNPRMFYGAKGGAKALDAGLVFFKEGNNIHRGTSFSLSFLKWRSENPTKMMSNDDLRRIVERADLMSLNMTRSSNAAWQGGDTWWQKALSVPAQFFAFQVRLSELMLGTRLTGWEKARLTLMNSALWGVPAGTAGAALGFVWPFAESTRQYAIENNIEISEGAPQLAMEGVVSMAVQSLTGENFDVEGRFGPGGLSWLRDMIAGESFEVMGAGPSFLTDAIKQTSPFAGAVLDVFSGNADKAILQSTFIDALRVSSTGNNAVKAYQVWNAGQYLTKGDKPVMETEAGDPVATIAAALGLSPQEVTDTYLKLRTNQDFRDMKTQVSNEALVWFERGLKSASNGEPELTRSFFDKAQAILETGDFTPLERSAVFQRAMQLNQSLLQQVDNDFLRNDPSRMKLNDPYANQDGGF